MNIWIINHYAVPTKYYPLARPATFAKYLMRAGHRVTIFAASTVHNSSVCGGLNKNLITNGIRFKEDFVDGIHYVYVKAPDYSGNGIKRIINMFAFPLLLPPICKKFENPDVILSVSATPMACMTGLKLAKKYHCKGIAEVADLWPESFVAYGLLGKGNPLLKPMYAFEKRMYTKADAIIFTMEGGRDYIIEKGWNTDHGGPIDLGKVHHINNGVDLEAFNYNKEHYTFADPDLDDDNTFKAVYCGSIRKVNNVGLLVDVAKKLQQDGHNNIKIIIYGDGDERAQLEAESAGLSNIVFKGRIGKKYIPFALSKSDLNLMHSSPSPVAKYGLSLNKSFEYMASGKPTLMNFVPNYDYIEQNGCGIVQNLKDTSEYVKAIVFFSKMREDKYAEYCNNAREAAEEYDFKKLTEKLICVLNEVK